MAKQNKVAVNLAQDFTDTEKAQARANIGAGTSDVNIKTTNIAIPPVDTNITNVQVFTDGRVRFDNTDVGVLAPTPGQDDSSKVLVARWHGSPINAGYTDWEPMPTELPAHTSAQAGKALVLNAKGQPIWDDVGGGSSSIAMASFRTLKTISIPGGNSSMITDLYKIYDLAPKTAVNMTVFVRDMDRNGLQMMGISIWCGTVEIDANSFTRGSSTSISHALPICYYNGGDTPIEIKIGFNGTFAQEDLEIEMMGFTISQGS